MAELERARSEEERETELEGAERQRREREERRAAEREGRERAEAERRAEKEHVRAERDAAEQQQKLERQRERRHRTERERAERKLAEQRRRERKQGRGRPKGRRRDAKLKAGAAEPTATAAKPPPAATRAQRQAKPRPPAQRASLKRPTAKAGVALAAVVAVAVGAGVLLGLPLPLVADPDGPEALAGTGPAVLDPGTPVGLTKGPYHPVVVSNPNYGEAAAKFGADRGGRRHEGQDVFARPGTPLVAVRDGVVVDGGGGKSFYSYGGGNTLAIYSRLDDRSYIYLHMLKPALVRAGERVNAGQLVGYVGCTGSCDGPHLHFEVRRGRAVFGPQKKAFDPLPLLKQWPVRPVGQ